MRVYAGPTIGYVINEPLKDVEISLADLNKLRVDAGLGAGVDILAFSVDVGYNFGLTELFTDTFDGKSNYAFVNVGIAF